MKRQTVPGRRGVCAQQSDHGRRDTARAPTRGSRGERDPGRQLQASAVADAATLTALAAGDAKAWAWVVDRYGGLLWAVARAHGLARSEAADVVQTTWMRLYEHAHTLRKPEGLGTWLAVVTRHEADRMRRLGQRNVLVGDDAESQFLQESTPPADVALLRAERDAALWRAFESLSPACRQLLRVFLADPPPTYAEVAAAMGRPVGSIGPTRARCLDCLRHHQEIQQLARSG
jgi:RNA polymerase sigma factor (sigma-70 family)